MARLKLIDTTPRGAHLLLNILIAIAVFSLTANAAQAEPGFPNRPLRIFVPYGPGGVGDLTIRMLGQKLTARMGKPIVIENRPGAGGTFAAKATLEFPADGYALLQAGNSAAIAMSLFKVRPYNIMRDFTLISLVASFEMLIATPVNSPYKTVQDIIAAARKNPGKLNFGAINPGSTQNLSAHLFKQMTGIDATVVTYRTTPDLVTGLLRNDVDVAFEYYAGLQPLIADKKIRIAAVAGETRSALLPDVPTAEESGAPGYVVVGWNALSAPAGLPPDILGLLNREINAAFADPELQEKTNRLGITARGSTPEAMRARMESEINRWAGVIEKSGIERQ